MVDLRGDKTPPCLRLLDYNRDIPRGRRRHRHVKSDLGLAVLALCDRSRFGYRLFLVVVVTGGMKKARMTLKDADRQTLTVDDVSNIHQLSFSR